MKFADIKTLATQTFKEFGADGATRLGAALAFYTVLSMAPLLVIAIGIAGAVFGDEAAKGLVADQIKGLIGSDSAQVVQDMIAGARREGSSIVATITGFVLLLFGASGVFGQLQDALNIVYDVKPDPELGIMARVKARFLSFGMVLVTGFLLLVSLVLHTVLAGLNNWLAQVVPGLEYVWPIVLFLVSLGIETVLFATIYRALPDVKLDWRDVWLGAFITAVLFEIGKFGLGWYLGKAGFASSYGAAGAVIAILVWVYYAAQIILLGAEFTQVYADTYGTKPQPSEHAVATEQRRSVAPGQGSASGDAPAGATPPTDETRGPRR